MSGKCEPCGCRRYNAKQNTVTHYLESYVTAIAGLGLVKEFEHLCQKIKRGQKDNPKEGLIPRSLLRGTAGNLYMWGKAGLCYRAVRQMAPVRQASSPSTDEPAESRRWQRIRDHVPEYWSGDWQEQVHGHPFRTDEIPQEYDCWQGR